MAYDIINDTDVEVLEDTTVEQVSIGVDLFSNDEFFKMHPDKILGEAYKTSGRFGEVTKYRGDITALSLIDADESFIGADKALIDPLASNFNDVNTDAAGLQPEVAKVIEQAISQSDNEVEGTKKKRARKIEIEDEGVVTPQAETLSFYDVYNAYNKDISIEELKVYVWNKTAIGKPLSKYYVSIFDPERFDADEDLRETYNYTVSQETIDEWVSHGLLFYFKGKLIPAYEYLSGNMYDKKIQLQHDKESIIAKFGTEAFEKQETSITEAFRKIYEKRLTIGGANGLVVLPISKFAADFKISRIEELPEEMPFKIKRVTAASDSKYGQPDILNDDKVYSDRDRHSFEELSLRDAFNFWLIKYKPQLKQPITHYDIVKYYVLQSAIRIDYDAEDSNSKKAAEAKREKLKSSTQAEGERLFSIFLETQLLPNDKIRLETQWNSDYNNFLPFDPNKIPVAFTMAKYVGGKLEELRPEKREAVAFVMNNGTGVLAYDVGVGKTPSTIFTISAFLDAGYCKRPLIVVPNQVYKQFISEIKMFAPHIPIIEGYNLSKEYVENFIGSNGQVESSPSGSITVMTYEGMELIGFTDATRDRMLSKLYDILNQGGASEQASGKKGEKQKASFLERLEMLVGKGMRGGMYNIEDFGFDFITYDEAHKMKKVFTSVKGTAEEDKKSGKVSRGKNPYVISSGTPSSIGLKGFMLNQYILEQNNYKNILLLTATPFTNSPLEIFSMMSMVAYEQLRETDLYNIKNFFDTYIKTSTELVINTKLKPQFKQVILGFNNLISLQSLIRRYILYKTGEDVGVLRPKKYVLPYVKVIEDGILMQLPEDKRVETYIEMTPLQKRMMDSVIAYVENGTPLTDSYEGTKDEGDIDEENEDTTEGIEVDEDALDSNQKAGVRTIRGLAFSRNIALSPYLYDYSGLGDPTAHEYITTSPKLTYVMQCVKSVRNYCIANGQPVAGQVIYMDRGIEYFKLIKEYLVNQVGYKEHEVGIIVSGLPKNGPRSKEYVKNLFNGEVYNEKTKEFEAVSDEQRIKVVIGSSTIKEGINLQKYGAVLYNCFIDWNPTDIQQLEGRIYRQKNTFDAVRIVNPLVVDSADIFMFQKLQEKTTRLNTIWSTDGKTNVLHTEEFNPEELKYALVRDPRVIAELKTIEERSKLDAEKLGYERQLEIADNVSSSAHEVNYYFDKAIDALKDYRDFKKTDDRLADAERLVKLINEAEKKQTDKDGKKIYMRYELSELTDKEREAASPLSRPFTKPYWFSYFSVATRDMSRFMSSFIKPYNIEFDILHYEDALKLFKEAATKKIAEITEAKNNLDSKERMDRLVQEIIEERERLKIEFKPLPQTVNDFSRLNYLLDKKVVILTPALPKYTTCPPLEQDGKPAITADGLKALEGCLKHENQTKDVYYNEETHTYTPEREKLHQEIVDKLFDGVKCVTKKKPVAIFTGGAPASGKSTFLKKHAPYLLSHDIFHLDADEIRAMLPEYKGWNANSTHLETQDIVNGLLDKLGSEGCRYDFVYDGTMNKAKKYFDLIRRVKDMGYETYIIFMEVPYAEAKKRAIGRYEHTGRYVPMDVIDDFFTEINGKTKGQAALDELKPLVDGYIVADGITGNVINKGGAALPKTRNGVYGGDVHAPEIAEEPEEQRYEDMELDDLIKLYKEKYSNIDISEPKSPDEKEMERVISLKHSDIFTKIREERKRIMDKYESMSLDDLIKAKNDIRSGEGTSQVISHEEKVLDGLIFRKTRELNKQASKKNKQQKHPVSAAVSEESGDITKEKIEKLIKALNLSLKFTSEEEDKNRIGKQIKALNLSLKFAA